MEEYQSKLRSEIKNIYLYMLQKEVKSIILNDGNLTFKSNDGTNWTVMNDEIAYIIGK